MAENIRNYGGVEGDSSDSAMDANVQAIDDASEAAGDNTVYLPEGEWYIGETGNITTGEALIPGSDASTHSGSAGLSFKGEGPDKSFLLWGTYKKGEPNGIRWSNDSDHPDVVWEDMTFDGNRDGLDPDTTDGAHWGWRVKEDLSGDWTLRNVRFTGWAGNAMYFSSGSNSDCELTIDSCTFYDAGIGVTQDEDGGSVSHFIVPPRTLVLKNTELRFCSGSFIDFRRPDSVATIENCWIEGIGNGMKVNGGDTIELSQVRFGGESDELNAAIADLSTDQSQPAFIYRLDTAGADSVPALVLNDVLVENTPRSILSISKGPDWEVQGGTRPVAATNVAYESGWPVVRAGNNSEMTFNSFGDLSVHNTQGDLFDASGSGGTIDQLNWDDADGLGSVGSISIESSTEGGSPFTPAVPSQGDVGINSDGSTDSTTVSWQSPDDGTTVGGTVQLQIAASDSEESTDSLAVEYRIDSGDWLSTTYSSDAGYHEASWDTATAGTGEHSLTARVTDADGNTSTATIGVTVADPVYEQWTPRWDSSTEDWGIVTGSDFQGEAALAFDASSSDRHAISWDSAGEPSDVEIVDRFRVLDSGLASRSQIRSSGTTGSENGYWLEFESREDAFRLGKYTSGDFATLGRFGSVETGAFFYRRLRADGNTLKAKVWKATESEPDGWDVEVTDDDHTAGWVGLGSFSASAAETDVVSIATGGETAQIPGTDSNPTATWVVPAEDETVSGTVSLQVDASDTEDDDSSLLAEYRVDGAEWMPLSYNSGSGYFEASWDSTAVDDGSHTLETMVTDSAGGTDSATTTVATDNAGTAPTVDTLSLSEVETDSGDAEFDVDWQVRDAEADLDTVDLLLVQDSDGSTEDTTSSTVSGETVSDTARLVASGDDGSGNGYTVELTVADSKGNTASETASTTASESGGTTPMINRMNVSEAGRPDPHAEVTVIWDVTDEDGDLESVDIDVADDSGTIQGVNWTINSASASDMDSFKIKDADGTQLDVTLTVSDESGLSVSETKSVTA